jgi:hypothetical protein
MATKINSLVYDTLLEVRYRRHAAELAIVHAVDNSAVFRAEVYTDGSKFGDSVGVAGIIL